MGESNLKPPRWQDASQSDWDLARRRETILRPLAELRALSHAIVDEAARELGLRRSVTYRLIARYRQRPRTSSLLPFRRGRKPQSHFIDDRMKSLIDRSIRRYFLTQERPRMSDLMRQIAVACDEEGLKAPNYRTVKRRIRPLDPRNVAAKRLGSKAAQDLYRPVQASKANLLLPLEVVQIDHTPVDVIVVDERERLPIGRPWLTLAIDVASRNVTGFYVSLDPPSTISVALVISHAVLTKESWLAERSLSISWPAAGIPDTLYFDNAPEFDCGALERGCQEHGINLDHRPLGCAHFGGHIERLIGTMMGAVHLLPGTTFSNVVQRGDYESEKSACLTFPELDRWLALQIVGVYHQSVHSALHRPPLQAWMDGFARRSRPPRQPAEPGQFFFDFLPGEYRLIRRDGIRLFNIHYWDSYLSPLCGRSKRPMLVKYDPRNLSRVYLQDGDGKHWPIPYRDLGLPPISLWEHREAMKRLRAEGRRMVDEKLIFAAIREQRELLESSRKSTRQRRSEERLRHSMKATTPLPSPSERAETQPDDSDLKPYEVEEWQ